VLKTLFRLKVDRRDYEPPKGPFVVISNHSTFMDFLVVMLALYPRRFNAVTAQKFFLYRPLNKLLPMCGCIPKNLFDPDIRAIKGIKAILKRGDRVLMFPEGRCSTDGVYAGVHKSTGKLIKNLGVPVISCHIEGATVCMPFWRKGLRPGRVRLTIAGLFSAEDTANLSVDEINNAIDARLSGFDTPATTKPFRTFLSRRLVEGLHTILYLCPGCGQEFVLSTKGSFIRCTACGNTAKFDRFARFTPAPGSVAPADIHEWFRDQVRYEMSLLSEDMEPITDNVTVRMPAEADGDGVALCGNGVIRLDPTGWHFDGELKGEQVSLFFPIETVPAIPFDPADNFQIYAHGSFYMITPDDPLKSIKYVIMGECAHWRFASNVQMTPGRDNGYDAVQKHQ